MLAVFVCAFPSFAQETASFRATLKPSYARIFIATPLADKLNIQQQGQRVVITAPLPISASFGSTAQVAGDYLTGLTQDNATTITLTLSGNTQRIRKFLGEGMAGIDLIGTRDLNKSTATVTMPAPKIVQTQVTAASPPPALQQATTTPAPQQGRYSPMIVRVPSFKPLEELPPEILAEYNAPPPAENTSTGNTPAENT
ncbi:MAG: hypothetical protein KDD76_06625, partial [Rickettsiales bacterium]|nr:hypothetical protein [Rickettsiales bacterium]